MGLQAGADDIYVQSRLVFRQFLFENRSTFPPQTGEKRKLER